jgi:hypothetical protein
MPDSAGRGVDLKQARGVEVASIPEPSGIRSGEALTMSVALQLHHLLAIEGAGGGRRYCGAGSPTW